MGGATSLVAQMVKKLETWVRSLGREDPLQKGMATHSIILAQRIPRTEEPGGLVYYSPWGCKERDTTEPLTLSPRPAEAIRNIQMPRS